ncbi:SH3 domain-containing protein [Streptomyces sp. NPDC052114]|uniref:SH3 domain-containing protein n=1 Tax=Streptomyces sp. NPDC052114 TaxID=3155528 RepID=UPI00341513F2
MRTVLGKTGVAVGALALMASPLIVAAPAAAADAMSCSHGYSNKSSKTGRIIGNGVNVRTGPHTSCGSTGVLNYDDGVYFHCWTNGTSVHGESRWWHIRVNTTNWQGWVSNYYIDAVSPTASEKC